jgi:hypothetical protein
MLTAPAACQPMPGPPGAAWPAEPGVTYCFPYPACCQPAAAPSPDRWSWLHTALAAAGPDTALYAALGLMALVTAVFIVIVRRDVRRIRARREARQRGRA